MHAHKAVLLGGQTSSAGTATEITMHGSKPKNDSTDRTDLGTMLAHGARPCPFGRFDNILLTLAHFFAWLSAHEHDITVPLQ